MILVVILVTQPKSFSLSQSFAFLINLPQTRCVLIRIFDSAREERVQLYATVCCLLKVGIGGFHLT